MHQPSVSVKLPLFLCRWLVLAMAMMRFYVQKGTHKGLYRSIARTLKFFQTFALVEVSPVQTKWFFLLTYWGLFQEPTWFTCTVTTLLTCSLMRSIYRCTCSSLMAWGYARFSESAVKRSFQGSREEPGTSRTARILVIFSEIISFKYATGCSFIKVKHEWLFACVALLRCYL